MILDRRGFTIIELLVGIAIAFLLVLGWLFWTWGTPPHQLSKSATSSPSAQSTASSAKIPEWPVFGDNSLGFSFHYPPNWSVRGAGASRLTEVVVLNEQQQEQVVIDFLDRPPDSCSSSSTAARPTQVFVVGAVPTKPLSPSCASSSAYAFTIQRTHAPSTFYTITLLSVGSKDDPLVRELLLSLEGLVPTKEGAMPSL